MIERLIIASRGKQPLERRIRISGNALGRWVMSFREVENNNDGRCRICLVVGFGGRG
jgi:hypothetical protein